MYWPWQTKILLLFFLFLNELVLAQIINLSPVNTTIEFEITHLGVLKVQGTFDEMKGGLSKKEGIWTITGVVKTSSINTTNKARDKALRSEAYLDAEKYPEIIFKGMGEEILNDEISVIGRLSLKDLNTDLRFNLIKQGGNFISNEIKLSRKEIGLSFDSMDTLIGDEISITIQISTFNN